MNITLGVDFDNTIVACGELFHRLAVDRGIIAAAIAQDKTSVRDAVRQREGGEIEWQELQALVYGPALQEASPVPGVLEALAEFRRRGAAVSIISHKTQFAARDSSRTDLRVAAMGWLRTHGIAGRGALVDEEQIFFAASRRDKVARIHSVGCTHFVDDLKETFLAPGFPSGVVRILFAPDDGTAFSSADEVLHTWEDIVEYVFETASHPDV